MGAKMLAHEFGFVLLERAGVGFLFRDTHFGQDVKNGFALDFQLSRQIVDSNLAHPFLMFPPFAPTLRDSTEPDSSRVLRTANNEQRMTID